MKSARSGRGRQTQRRPFKEPERDRQEPTGGLESADEKRFRILADNAPVMIWLAGPDKRCTFFNKPWLDFTGRSMEQEVGNGWASGVHAEDMDRCLAVYTSSFDARRGFRMEYRLRRADGEYRWILDHGVPLYLDGEFAGYIGSCVDLTERKQVEAQHVQSQKDLRALTGRLLGLQESGMRELARELHDVFSQELAALGIELSSVKNDVEPGGKVARRLSKLREKISRLAVDIHRTSRELHPAIVEDLGLAPALQQECESFQQRTGIRTEFIGSKVPARIPRGAALCLYRIAQESLRNVHKHSASPEVAVRLEGGRAGVTLRIEDSGEGFDPDVMLRKGGVGLVSMEERIRLVKGKLTVKSQPGRGTTVTAFVPLRLK